MKKGLNIVEQAKLERVKLDFSKRLDKAKKSGSYFKRLQALMPTFKSLPPGKQENFINAKQLYKYAVGGFRSGKTEVLGAGLTWLAFENRPVAGMILSPTMTSVQLIVKKKFEELCEKNGIGYEVYPSKYSGVIEFHFLFGTKKEDKGIIYLTSEDAMGSWIGMTVGFGGMDEPFRMKKETNDAFISRISDGKAKLPMIMYSGTPEPELQNWGIDIVEKGEENSSERFITRLSTRDNNFNRKGYVEGLLKIYDTATARNYIDGIPTLRRGDRIYYMYQDERNMIPEIEIKKKELNKVMVVYDFNVNPMTATEWILREKEFVIVNDYMLESSNTWDLTETILASLERKYDKKNISLIVTGDRTSLKRDTRAHPIYNPIYNDYTIIKRMFDSAGWKYHMVLPDVNPDVRDRCQWVNNLLEKGYLKITQNCSHVRDDFRFVTAKKGIQGFEKDKSKDPNRTHISDTVDYGAILIKRMGFMELFEDLGMRNEVTFSDPRRKY